MQAGLFEQKLRDLRSVCSVAMGEPAQRSPHANSVEVAYGLRAVEVRSIRACSLQHAVCILQVGMSRTSPMAVTVMRVDGVTVERFDRDCPTSMARDACTDHALLTLTLRSHTEILDVSFDARRDAGPVVATTLVVSPTRRGGSRNASTVPTRSRTSTSRTRSRGTCACT